MKLPFDLNEFEVVIRELIVLVTSATRDISNARNQLVQLGLITAGDTRDLMLSGAADKLTQIFEACEKAVL